MIFLEGTYFIDIINDEIDIINDELEVSCSLFEMMS